MASSIQRELEDHRVDYAKAVGRQFRHFYCPLLMRDDEAELCLGHVVNEAIPNSCRAQVLQRKDIDGWYGRMFEPDFIKFMELKHTNINQIMSDRWLFKKHRPALEINGKEYEYYPYNGQPVPAGHTPLKINHRDGSDLTQMVVKLPSNSFLEKETEDRTGFVLERDGRVVALITLVKSAYLTLFKLLGYQWALSSSGLEIGHSLLGKFYLDNKHHSHDEVRKSAKIAFSAYRHMIRPIIGYAGEPPRGTVEDGRVSACFGSSGRAFGMIVFVRTNSMLNGVFMPDYSDPESAATYWQFLNNENEKLWISQCLWNRATRTWEGSDERVEVHWPKDNCSLDDQ